MPEILVKKIGTDENRWIEINEWQEEENILAVIKAYDLLPWVIEDSQGFYDINLRSLKMEKVVELAHMIIKHGEAYAGYYGMINNDSEADFIECYRGRYDSEIDFVKEQMEQDGTLSIIENTAGLKANYINWKQLAHDWFIFDYVSVKAENGEVFVFHNR